MPRRRKAFFRRNRTQSIREIYDVSSLLSSMDVKWDERPDGSIIVSSAAVDAYRAHCGGTYNDMLVKFQPAIRRVYEISKNNKPGAGKPSIERVKLGKSIVVIEAIRSQTFKEYSLVLILIRAVAKIIINDINTLESAIAFSHLLKDKQR